jgi:hypothetical protein
VILKDQKDEMNSSNKKVFNPHKKVSIKANNETNARKKKK